ncbi:pancreatic lipase-related protein 2-like isoform X1 [Ostrinia furnacalis]|uniref:pancreatic lipase-related protein 2-like isoform X1 n=1 Tax=Ostrinia furnacalis TaxID=93504 RepID=UPI00104050A7|nr:pancreatic lipase-related protein 2-like isoform X1 [Ostrinia furnacalis]
MHATLKYLLVLSVAIAASGHSLQPGDVVFHLFTRQNPQESRPVLPTFASLLNSTVYNPTLPTIISIHTSGQGVGGNFAAFIVRDHLAREDVNIFAVDWSPGSSMYSEGLSQAPQCGRIIANFINDVIIAELSYDVNQIRFVGHGLGAHVAGIAARLINGNVPHIFALDPSLVGWTHHPERLNPDDATLVEVLHTTAGILGYDYPLGDLDFYPNGGSFQPGCATDVSCSHTYAYAFYAESLTSEITNGAKFVGTKCDSYDQAITMSCSGDKDAIFGGTETKTRTGIYTFSTNIFPPFAQG